MKKLFHNLVTFLIVAVMLVPHNVVRAGSVPFININTAITPPAFPGAEGFGAGTLGGRGGKIIEVTNLNDSGSGSLRSCVEASGARTCVFRTGGLINLLSTLRVGNPFITIAGQTAPGGGITLKTSGSGADTLSIATHDVIVRYISFRPGPGGSNHGAQIASEGVALYNIIIDHSTFSWGVDSNIETWYRVYDTTIQWSLISEALDCSTHPKGCHSKGIMIGGFSGNEDTYTKGAEEISVHHNLIAHVGERAPLMQVCGIAQIVNNVTYNPYWTFAHQQNNCPGFVSYVNWIGNYHKKGPDSTSNTDLKVIPADSGTPAGGGTKIYVQGNIGPSRTDNSQPDSNWVESGSRSYIVAAPAPVPVITTTDALTAYNNVLADAGNNAGLSCNGTWVVRRDAIDTRVVNEVINGTGHIIDKPSDVGGWITPASGIPCADGDHDGMPDVWEIKYGLNPNNNSDTNGDLDGDGYTNIEEFINATDPTGGIVTIPLTVIGITASDKTYDGTTTAVLDFNGATLIGVVPGDDVTLYTSNASAEFSDKNVGAGKTVTVSGLALTGTDAYKYSLAQPTGLTADIISKGVIVTAVDRTKAVGQPDPVFTFTASGFLGVDTFVTNPTCRVADVHDVTGAYDIVCSGGDAGANYTISSYVKGTLTVFSSPIQTMTLRSTGSRDGWILESSETSGVGGTLNTTAATFNLGDNAMNKQYCSILSFDTSTLPDNAVVTGVKLTIKLQSIVGTNPFTTHGELLAEIRKPFFGSSLALAVNDFQSPADQTAGLFDATPVNNWYSVTLGPASYAYINLAGTTQFRLRFQKDDNDDRGADFMKFFSGNYASANAKPTLVIEYTVP